MARTIQYEKILADLDAGEMSTLQRLVLEKLKQSPQGVTRQALIRFACNKEPRTNLNNDPNDRKIRKAIEGLRDMGYLIISSSGEAGYRLTTNPETIAEMLVETQSRIAHLERRDQNLRRFLNYPHA